PMKSIINLDSFNLKNNYNDKTLIINIKLPTISNIASDNYFGAISKANDTDELVMFIVKANQKGITLDEKSNFLGVKGSATFAIEMKNVEIPESQIITKEAKSFASAIRPQF